MRSYCGMRAQCGGYVSNNDNRRFICGFFCHGFDGKVGGESVGRPDCESLTIQEATPSGVLGDGLTVESISISDSRVGRYCYRACYDNGGSSRYCHSLWEIQNS